ncbi:MAG: glutamate--tRNA ligase [Alphaproteobacteria bacterium]|nr:glutamate--tRNA ligase [Alphaproteobacteria bacterium SS10]
MSVVTRFAPSPTGFLHIGGARTALFNWLFAKHHGGTCLLRIEDTDRARSTKAAIGAIIEGLEWFGLDFDGDPIFQYARRDRHVEVVEELLAKGGAYRCYASQEELDEMRAAAKAAGKPMRYDGRWRDRDASEAPDGVDPVIRLKAPLDGDTVINDAVQGKVTIANAQLDDMVLLRSDGSPTYMLSVVVDDHDMGITHVIRGDDHLTNAFRQHQLYQAMGWDVPTFAHIPLIHGPDGAKLSKRHGALGLQDYREMGFLPEAMQNYLLRLGWSHGDDEIINTQQAIEWFDLNGVGRAPSRLDADKLAHVNSVYLRDADPDRITDLILARRATEGVQLSNTQRGWLKTLLPMLIERHSNINELADNIAYLEANGSVTRDEKTSGMLTPEQDELVAAMARSLADLSDFTEEGVSGAIKTLATDHGLKMGKVAPLLRAALCGTMQAPSIFAIAGVLGRDECLARIGDARQQITASVT